MSFNQIMRNMLAKNILNRSLWLNIWWCLPTNSETETNIDEKKIKAVVHLYCNWNGTPSIIGWLLSLVNQKLATPNAPFQDISRESYRCLHKISLIIDGCHIQFETRYICFLIYNFSTNIASYFLKQNLENYNQNIYWLTKYPNTP